MLHFLLFIHHRCGNRAREVALSLGTVMTVSYCISSFLLIKDAEITLLANLITLTPGTLSVDVSDDRKYLYVHSIDCSDVEALIDDIRNGFERKILEVFR